MSILGLDYGKKRIGVAISFHNDLIKPLGVYSRKNFDETLSGLFFSENIEKIIIGLPEGKLVKEIRLFAKNIEQKYKVQTEFEDETLTSLKAKGDILEIGSTRRKRKKLLDAYAAGLILENYLEKQK